MKSKRADGSSCPEGTQSVFLGFVPCCHLFGQHTQACYFDIRYEWWSPANAWFTIIAPVAGGGGIEITFCPHCGAKLALEPEATVEAGDARPQGERPSQGPQRAPGAAAHIAR